MRNVRRSKLSFYSFNKWVLQYICFHKDLFSGRLQLQDFFPLSTTSSDSYQERRPLKIIDVSPAVTEIKWTDPLEPAQCLWAMPDQLLVPCAAGPETCGRSDTSHAAWTGCTLTDHPQTGCLSLPGSSRLPGCEAVPRHDPGFALSYSARPKSCAALAKPWWGCCATSWQQLR